MNDLTPPSRPPLALGPVGPAPAGQGGEDHDDGIGLGEIVSVLRRRRAVVAGAVVASVALVALLIRMQTPEYRSESVVQIQDARRQMTGSLENQVLEQMRRGAPDPIVSQLQVLRSRAVLSEVVDSDGLRLVSGTRGLPTELLRDRAVAPEVPADTLSLRFDDAGVTATLNGASATAPYGSALEVAGVRFRLDERPRVDRADLLVLHREQAIAHVASRLRARQREQTDVVDLEYTASSPEVAQAVLASALTAFQRFSVDRARAESRRRRAFIEEQLAATDSMLSGAQGALSDFRRREHVYSSQEMFAAQQSGLMALDVRREELDANRRMYRSLLTGVRGAQPGRAGERLQALVAAPEIASNPVIASLYQQLTRLEAQRDSITSGPWARAAVNPDVERLDQQIQGTTGRIESAVTSHLGSLDARVEALDGLRARAADELERLPATEAEEARLALQFQTIRRMADQLRDEYQRARIAEAVEAGSVAVLDAPSLPLAPVGSSPVFKLALGLLFGLMLGTGGAFLVENLNRSVRSRDEMEELTRLPGLAVIPKLEGQASAHVPRRLPRFPLFPARNGASGNGNGTGPHRGPSGKSVALVTVSDVRSPGSDAFRMLRTNLLFSSAAAELHTLVVTSTAPGEGKTTTSANLAVTYAQQGLRVLLADCDLRRPRVHEVFEVFREPGLTQLILGMATPEQAIRTTDTENLSVLPAGALPPNPTELLGSERMRSVLQALKSEFDVVILDTPPIGVGADGAILAAESDAAILVVRAGSTDRAAVAHSVQQLHAVGARLLGGVLNDMHGELPKYGGYYGYAYSYAAD